MKITELVPDSKNANKGTLRGLKYLDKSLRQNGAGRSILIDAHNRIIAGNKTASRAADIGLDDVIVVETDGTKLVAVKRTDLDLEQGGAARELAYADNWVGQIDLDWDAEQVLADLEAGDEALKEMLLELAEQEGIDILGEQAEAPEPQIDRAEELREKWGVETGQLWNLPSRSDGISHKLFCGSASEAAIECKFAIYDPPFDWSYSQQETALSWVKWETALLMGLHYCMPLAVRHDFCHWWIWDSGMARFAGRGYKPMSGCAICLIFGNKRNWYENQGLAALDRADVGHYDFPTQVVHIQDSLGGSDHTRKEKPYPLVDYIVSLYSQDGDIIGDPFAGAGITVMVCENLKRQYHGSEISPENCAVILDRYVRTFGIEPVLL